MTSKSSPPDSPNIIFDSLISILAVNSDLLNIASISFIFFFIIYPGVENCLIPNQLLVIFHRITYFQYLPF